MIARSLGSILAGVRGGPPLRLVGGDQTTVDDVTIDSRTVRPGSLFCCVPGACADGHEFAPSAVASGASALLVEHELPLDVAQIVTADARTATGWLSASFYGHPFDSFVGVGVTGTNGKTTTSQLIGAALRHLGHRVEVLGTLSGERTTPEAPDLQRLAAGWRGAGITACAMEVSSHALALQRVAGARFDVAVFTNLGRDHLDFHGTIERYFAAKSLLFEPDLAGVGIVNVDDVHGRALADHAGIRIVRFSMADVTDVRVSPTHHSYRWRGAEVSVGIGGGFNVMNSLAAATACAELGFTSGEVADALSSAGVVPGRFEPIDVGQPFSVVVDYAHTPEGLRQALLAARSAASGGRLIVVFGCGGDRDPEKRPAMGAAAAELADAVVITSDNPRSEDPAAIIDATVSGVPAGYRTNVVIEPDRRSAIALALTMAEAGDVVLVAGKGHETTQTVGRRVLPFDDRIVVRELLEVRP
jgi:UDP-N-acetylmuramoyl-L-alanyl-D-glutamate--2,6-diaminopimelate ligase